MKMIINGVEFEGTPAELYEFNKLKVKVVKEVKEAPATRTRKLKRRPFTEAEIKYIEENLSTPNYKVKQVIKGRTDKAIYQLKSRTKRRLKKDAESRTTQGDL